MGSFLDTVLSVVLSLFPFKTSLILVTPSVVFLTFVFFFTNTWITFDQILDKHGDFFTVSNSACQGDTFDYIIVGSGAAGMVVATRLANYSKGYRVLLLEAGGEPTYFNELPVMNLLMVNHPSNTWIYNMTKQTRCCQICYDGRPFTARGKMLGGSTSLNFNMYVRGHPEDFNGWAADVQDPLWNYKNVLPYFKKSEDYKGVYSNERTSSEFHGKGGLLHISSYDYEPGIDDFLGAGAEKGYKIGDYNGADGEGEVFSRIDLTTQDGYRESTFRAFYADTGQPTNLCVRKYANVEKINFACGINGNPMAAGVTFRKHGIGGPIKVRASQEVILSAGTFESPKLLMLSGVGPREHLRSLGIPLVKDLPVGQNLQDHLGVFVGPFLKGPSFDGTATVHGGEISKFLWDRSGVLAAPNGLVGTAFLQSSHAEPPYPDLQLVQFSVSLFPDFPKLINRFTGFSGEIFEKWLHPFHLNVTGSRYVALFLGRSKSTGQVTLASSSPNDAPIIDPNYLSHPDDMKVILEGFKRTVDLYENTKALNVSLFPKPVPGCEHVQFKSDDYYRCAIKQLSLSFYHHVGTCSLGKVVGTRLKVKGVDGLRVIDASIMPRVPNANTQAATIMIGEKGADMIVEDRETEKQKDTRYRFLTRVT